MSEILLVNPRRRRKKARKSNPRRKKRRASSRRKRNPGFALPAALGNPRRRKRRRSGGRRRRARGYRRNPAPKLSVRGIQGQIMGALPGAFGALALDVALGYIPVPAAWKAGYAGYAVKAAAAIGVGMIAANFVRGSTAAKMTEGALTVMFHGLLKSVAQQALPSVPLSDYNEGSGWNPSVPLSAYLPNIAPSNSGGEYLDQGGMNAYLTDQDYM